MGQVSSERSDCRWRLGQNASVPGLGSPSSSGSVSSCFGRDSTDSPWESRKRGMSVLAPCLSRTYRSWLEARGCKVSLAPAAPPRGRPRSGRAVGQIRMLPSSLLPALKAEAIPTLFPTTHHVLARRCRQGSHRAPYRRPRSAQGHGLLFKNPPHQPPLQRQRCWP
jgi:hypothetical protein